MSNQAAWLVTAEANPLKVDSAPYPKPAANEVIIKNGAVAINPVDWKLQDDGNFRGFLDPEKYPAILGEDLAGEIVEVGSNVTNLQKGQRVMAVCQSLATGEYRQSAFQLYVVASSAAVSPIPASISFAQGSVLPLAVTTAASGLYPPGFLELPLPPVVPAPPDKNKTLLVWGAASSVGSATVQLATASGVTVFATASPRNFEFVKSLGAAQVFDHSKADIVKEISDALKGTQLLGAYDAISSPETLRKSAEIVKAVTGKGFVCAVLDPPDDLPDGIESKSCIALHIFFKYQDVATAIWGKFVPEALKDGRLQPKPEPLVVGKGLDKIQDGFDKQKAGISGKKVVVEL